MAAEYTERDREPNLYEELGKFFVEMHERLERERTEADHLEERAKFARRQASETTTVYETIAKLLESMANRPADKAPSFAYTSPAEDKRYRVT